MAAFPAQIVSSLKRTLPFSPYSHESFLFFEVSCRLGWLIDPRAQRVEIYRPGQAVEILIAPKQLSGEAVLPGLVVPLSDLLKANP